jgi:ferrous iron transport protein A
MTEIQRETLDLLAPGEVATVERLTVKGSMRRRFLDIGLIEGTDVECVGKSPGGDPSAYLIRGAVIAIRKSDCRGICITRKAREYSPWD